MKKILLLLFFAGFGTSAFAQELPWDVNGRGLSFIPDYTFKGSALTGWGGIGTNKWQAAKGEIKVNPNGGNAVLASARSFQDVGVNLLVKAEPGTEAGVLVRLQKSAEGYKGILVTLTDSDAVSYRITLAADGKELSRERLRPAGNIIRVAPPAPAGGNEQQQRRGNGGRGNRPAGPAGLLARPSTAIVPGDWNQMEIIIDFNIIRKFINDGGDGTGGATEDTDGSFGTIALWAKGSGEIAFKDIRYKDMAVRYTPKEATSQRFSAQRISDMFYSFTASAADFNNDGKMDVAAGPYIYYGPDFTNYREVFFAQTYNPSREFADANCMYAFDFNNDGWQDIFIGAAGPPRIYLNPKGESRRWDKYEVVKGGVSEVTVFNDLNGDGKPELIYGQNGAMWYARFNPADALKPWKTVQISAAGYYMPHGIGTGDINGDGRVDIVNPHGWWEQPAKGQDEAKWIFHSEAFARYGHRSVGAGGSVMAVYDVNGDSLNDVVTSLNAHGFGIGWFEQKRDTGGKISFVKHLIADDYSVENPGGVAISEIHGTNFADIDGDKIPDFIVGKRYWSHLDSYFDPDPYGPPVVYVYKTVRDKKAPGGARFVPELVHNRSGAGSDIAVADLDKNGTIDIITSTDRGTYIFWNKGTGKK